MKAAELADKKIGILGIGREGQAVREYLRDLCPGITLDLICESLPDPEFAARLSAEDQLLVGPLSEARLETYDLLVRSPGVSIYRDAIQRAKTAGTEFTTPSTLWFAGHKQAKTICITGTKGKSTTSALIAHLLRACGFRVQLAGNIGLPLLGCDDGDVDWWVIELSSYQLADLEATPTVALIINVADEHLDWHGGVEAYRQDKLRLISLAAAAPVIANAADPVLVDALSGRAKVHWFNSETEFHVADSRIMNGTSELDVEMPQGLPGMHNLSNAAAALSVIRVIGADMEIAVKAISSFESLPHRLQTVGERAGVCYVNDSISSTPLATSAALQALSGNTITLIVGGLDRGLDWTLYMDVFKSCPAVAIIALPDNGRRIIDTMRESGLNPDQGFHLVAGLPEAVLLAEKLTPAGGVVLLSPGAPSFPQFKDYQDRGRQFARLCGFELKEGELSQAQCKQPLEK